MDAQPTYAALLAEVEKQKSREESFRAVILEMEGLYAEVAAGQAEIKAKNKELEEERAKLRVLNEELQKAKETADAASRTKSAFLRK